MEKAQLCRSPPWDGLALTRWPQPAASTQLTHPHLSSVLQGAANSAAFKANTTCTTEMKGNDEEKAIFQQAILACAPQSKPPACTIFCDLNTTLSAMGDASTMVHPSPEVFNGQAQS